MTKIAVIDHGAGNLVSIAQGLRAAGADVLVASSPAELAKAEGIVLPGVGATRAAMARLEEAELVESLHYQDKPLLGICVGLQLLFDDSEEHDNRCLGLIPGTVRRLAATRLPHIGWNDLDLVADPIFAGLAPGTPFYFVHSYAPVPKDAAIVIGTAVYGSRFTAAVRRGQTVGVQFHPERSGTAGLRVLGNFVASCGEQADAA